MERIFKKDIVPKIAERKGCTKSIYPTCIAHSVNNNISASFFAGCFMTESALAKANEAASSIHSFSVMLISLGITAVVSMSLLMKKK